MQATTITLSDSNAHNLYDVLTGKDTSGVSVGHSKTTENVPTSVKSLGFQAQTANAGTVRIGDSSISSTDSGIELLAGDARAYGPTFPPSISLAERYIRASAATQKLNVEWEG